MGKSPVIMLEIKYEDELQCVIRVLLIPEMAADYIPEDFDFQDLLFMLFEESLKERVKTYVDV